MIVALDADYQDAASTVALVGFTAWTDAAPQLELVVHTDAPPATYEPGRFFARELPHLRAILALVDEPIELAIIDGYVALAPDRPGLGMHLHRATGLPVVGIAKTRFANAPSIDVVRGTSTRPLHVTTVGFDAPTAAAHLAAMHGPYRIPTLLTRADARARGR